MPLLRSSSSGVNLIQDDTNGWVWLLVTQKTREPLRGSRIPVIPSERLVTAKPGGRRRKRAEPDVTGVDERDMGLRNIWEAKHAGVHFGGCCCGGETKTQNDHGGFRGHSEEVLLQGNEAHRVQVRIRDPSRDVQVEG